MENNCNDLNYDLGKHLEETYIFNAEYVRPQSNENFDWFIVERSGGISNIEYLNNFNYYIALNANGTFYVLAKKEERFCLIECELKSHLYEKVNKTKLILRVKNDYAQFDFVRQILYEDKYSLELYNEDLQNYENIGLTYSGRYELLEKCEVCGSSDFLIEVKYSRFLQVYCVCKNCGHSTGIKKIKKTELPYKPQKYDVYTFKPEFKMCPTCENEDLSFRILSDKNRVAQYCEVCGWQSPEIKREEKKNTRKDMVPYSGWRIKVFTRDGYKCVRCGSNHNIEAHHIIRVADDPEGKHIFDVDNGETLCKECHMKEHGKMKYIRQSNLS